MINPPSKDGIKETAIQTNSHFLEHIKEHILKYHNIHVVLYCRLTPNSKICNFKSRMDPMDLNQSGYLLLTWTCLSL